MDDLIDYIATLSPQKRALLELRLKEKGSDVSGKQTIPRVINRDSLPLSFAQQRLWFLDQLEPSSPLYNISKAVRLSGSLNVEALQKTLHAIVARHEALRTVFVSVDGNPVQVITANRPVELVMIDLRELSADRETEVQRLLQQEIQSPFNLSSDLMLRATLLRLSESDHVLLLVMHHVTSDGWSLGILMDELAALYEAFSENRPSPLPDLPIQYADFAVWQREWLQGKVLETHLSYWKNQLSGVPVLELLTDRPRPAVQTFRGARKSLLLPKTLSDGLKAISRKEGATLFMTLLAAFQTLLHRYTGQEDIGVGSPIANRTRAEIEGLLGFFVNTLVLRTDLSGNPSFRELLARVRKVALGAYEHQDLPFEKLVEELNPDRTLNRTPLFQVMFVLQNTRRSSLKLPGLGASPIPVDSTRAKFELTLSMADASDSLTASLEYNTDLFEASTINHMLNHFQILLQGIAANPERRLSDLPMLTESEKRKILAKWNDTKRDYPKDLCIHQLFEAQVKRTPEAVAAVFEDQQLTYQDLNRRANQLAHHLQKLGVGPEVLVGICVERSLEMVVGLLAILKAGAAYLPLDPTYPKDRIAFMLEDAQVKVLLTQRRLVAGLPEHDANVLCLDADWHVITQESGQNPLAGVMSDNLAYVIYTSGSTGRPKGVELQHAGLVNLVTWHQRVYSVTPADRATQLAATAFDASVWELWPYLTGGASIHIPNEDVLAFPSKLLAWLAARAITICFLPTPLAETVLEEPWPECLALRVLLTGGDKLHGRPRKALPFCLANNYGPTENTVVTTWAPVAISTESVVSPPIGRPIANTQVYLLDSHLDPVPIGVAGQISITGSGLARGYLKQPDLTAEKFIPNPFSAEPGARLYRTGDLARYLPDGNIEFLGRIDNQVKIRGFRIELGEVETVLAKIPGIREAVVVVREDEANKRLVAYVLPNPDSIPTTAALRSYLKSKLPDYMIPSTFVFLDALPLTPNGKVDRRALPSPDQTRPELEEAFVAPRSPLESEIAGIWAEILKLERIGINDNFFDLGGHSLLATRLVSRLRQALHIDVPLRSLFENPTVATLAAEVAQTQAKDSAPKMAELLADLESLSEEEAQRLVAEQDSKNI